MLNPWNGGVVGDKYRANGDTEDPCTGDVFISILTDAIPEKYWHTNMNHAPGDASTKLSMPIVALAVMVCDLAFRGQRIGDIRSDRELREMYKVAVQKIENEDSDLFWDGSESTAQGLGDVSDDSRNVENEDTD